MSRVLLAGASGQLGSAIASAFADRQVVAHTRATLDVTDAGAVQRAVAGAAPSVVINCAAFNDVDAAEDHPADAFAVNALAVRSLARAAEDSGAALVHFGTDFVFDGEANEPYSEEAAPAPRSTYAMSKLVGEWFALDCPRGYVLRVESLFGLPARWQGRRGTLDTIAAAMEQGRPVKVFTDRVVSLSYVVDIASATRHLVETGALPGLYHCVNSGHATWHDVAVETARLLGLEPRLEPITTSELRLKAPRPRFCALANRKLAATGFRMASWQDAVARWIATRRLVIHDS
ncbi:MAG TPA: NAD(P)-dependent oxidoreductase [Vicinamibacterales bacterium]